MSVSRRLLPLLALFALASCGGEETFDAQGFVDAANAEGAGIILGDPLRSDRDVELHQLEFPPDSATGAHGADEGHGGGTLSVSPDAEAAETEYENCESSVTLLCYRAANIVVILEGESGPAVQTRLGDAIRSLASG